MITPAIEYLASPNHSSREGTAIAMIVMHATVGDYKSSLDWLRNPQLKNPKNRVSTHYLIRKDGHIAQLVADDRAAWHAGVSSWRWRDSTQIQLCSLGIELENANTGHDPYPAAQLESARQLCRARIARYRIAREDLVRHLDIAPRRKTDPAGLDWPAFVASVYALPPAPTLPPPTLPILHYRVKRILISEREAGGAPYAGELEPGAPVDINMLYSNGMAHMANGAGFVKQSDIDLIGAQNE